MARAPRLRQERQVRAPAPASAPRRSADPVPARARPVAAGAAHGLHLPIAAPRANATGLPDRLKAGVEALSGVSLDGVKVHYNSARPARLNSLAYAQGRDIHLARGQERHLPHEAWHLVQQAQGRVRPTMQMKGGVAVNDDAGLEREADLMGARALRGAGSPRAANALAALSPASASAPAQRWVDPNPNPLGRAENAATEGSFEWSLTHLEQSGVPHLQSWIPAALDIYQLIEAAAPADQTERNWLAAIAGQADALVNEGNQAIQHFDTQPDNRVANATALAEINGRVKAVLAVLHERYWISEGFNAKGRATAVEGAQVVAAGAPGVASNAFLSGVSIRGKRLTDTHKVVKPAVAPDAGAQRLRVNGLLQNPAAPAGVKANLTAEFGRRMTAPKGAKLAPLVGNFASRAREGGQEINMNNTNARGYAWATGSAGWDSTRWEWLHIRGASLGGETKPSNLVLGTRDSNTHMMPFESHLKSLAKQAIDNPDYGGLNVTWTLKGQAAGASHKYSQITIDWVLKPASTHRAGVKARTDKQPSGQATFSPLNAGAVLSKAEVQHLEDALKEDWVEKAKAERAREKATKDKRAAKFAERRAQAAAHF